MRSSRSLYVLILISFRILQATSQNPPPPQYDTVLQISSSPGENITISYKAPSKGTCTTVFDTQRQFTGYVTIPPSVSRPEQGNITVNTFFWFVEARQLPETSPLTVFINGGPGASSQIGLFQEVGPCEVVELSRDRLGTNAREWGWDRGSNMLFIDQPVQTGLSFDSLTNGSLNLLSGNFTYPPTSIPETQPAYTFLNGTSSSDNPAAMINTSQSAATTTWNTLQAFLQTFPQYSRPLNGSASLATTDIGINLFAESYGGRYGPAIASYFQKQSALRLADPALANTTLGIKVQNLGIINGLIDSLVQDPYFATFAYNNSYGIRAITQVQQLNALSSFRGAGGCAELTQACRSLEPTYDLDDRGTSPVVNEACAKAVSVCSTTFDAPYLSSNRSPYDITQSYLTPFPSELYQEYLNTREVQQSIGVPLNYTAISSAVAGAFSATGDWARRSGIDELASLLNAGTRIALIYGDKDYVCNWLGGEAISFAIAAAAGPTYSSWYNAGYAPIVTNDSYIGGVVREFGNLSFSRIYDAGHTVPAYQPETAFTVFSRIISKDDISLGQPADLSLYRSFGDANSTHQNTAPPQASPVCYIRAVDMTCDVDHKKMLANGAGVIINGVLYNSERDWESPDPAVVTQAGVPGILPSSIPPVSSISDILASGAGSSGSDVGISVSATGSRTSRLPTGVFTATGVPSITTSSSNAAAVAVATPFIKANEFSGAAVVVILGCVGAVI